MIFIMHYMHREPGARIESLVPRACGANTGPAATFTAAVTCDACKRTEVYRRAEERVTP